MKEMANFLLLQLNIYQILRVRLEFDEVSQHFIQPQIYNDLMKAIINQMKSNIGTEKAFFVHFMLVLIIFKIKSQILVKTIIMLFRNSICLWKVARAKKPSQNSRQKPDYMSIKEKQVNEKLKRTAEYRKQVQNMQVASQVVSDSQKIKQVIQDHRKCLKQLDQFSRVQFIPRLLALITGLNFLGFGVCLIAGKYYLGMWIAGVLHPSFIISSTILIGYNTAFLIMKSSLKLDISDSQLDKMQELELVRSSNNIWFNTALIILQSGLLIHIYKDLLIGASYQTLFAYISLTFALIYQAGTSVPQQMAKTKKNMNIVVLSFCVLYGIYMIAYLTPQKSVQQGIDQVLKRYKIKKFTIQNGPINIETREAQTQQ